MTDKWYDKVNKSDKPKRVRVSKSTLIKAIKENCLECGGGSMVERKLCTVEHCKLWPYRLGLSTTNLEEAAKPTLPLEKTKHDTLLKKISAPTHRKAPPTNPRACASHVFQRNTTK